MMQPENSVTIRVGEWWGEIGIIDSAFLGFEDHGIFAVDLGFSFGASHQGIGCLILGAGAAGIDGAVHALDLLRQLTRVVGPLTECCGKTVMVLRDEPGHGQIVGLQQLVGDKRVIWRAYQ